MSRITPEVRRQPLSFPKNVKTLCGYDVFHKEALQKQE